MPLGDKGLGDLNPAVCLGAGTQLSLGACFTAKAFIYRNRSLIARFRAAFGFILWEEQISCGAGVGIILGIVRHVFPKICIVPVFARLGFFVVLGLDIGNLLPFLKAFVIFFTLVSGVGHNGLVPLVKTGVHALEQAQQRPFI